MDGLLRVCFSLLSFFDFFGGVNICLCGLSEVQYEAEMK